MKYWKTGLAILLCFHLFLLFKIQFTAWPEMLFWPYLILKGWLPYRDIAVVHTLLLLVYLTAVYKFIGATILSQKIATWLLILAGDLLFFYLLKRIADFRRALMGLGFYIILQVYYQGNGIWFDHALALFPFLIFYLLKKEKYLLAGIIWALAFWTKQTAFWLLLPVLFSLKPAFIKGAAIIFVIAGLILLALDLHLDFYHWAIAFGVFTLPHLSGQVSPPTFREAVSAFVPFLIVIPFILFSKDKHRFQIVLWLIAGAMGAFPRFELFHFQPAFPFLAYIYAAYPNKKTLLYIVPVVFSLLMIVRSFQRQVNLQPRFYNSDDQKLVQLIKVKAEPGDQIYVAGWWDNLYPLTGTTPAVRPFIPLLPWYPANQFVKSDYNVIIEEGNIVIYKPK